MDPDHDTQNNDPTATAKCPDQTAARLHLKLLHSTPGTNTEKFAPTTTLPLPSHNTFPAH
jgi:hypothetical protein